MDAQTLANAMGNVKGVDYAGMAPTFTQAMELAGCDTPLRAAMFCAQVGHESLGLKYMEEIADGSRYEARKDLGNIYPGDGKKFKGRGPIQITGRYNYTEVSQWAYHKGLVPTKSFFVDSPGQLATVKYGFLGTVWYWTVARPSINTYADKGDLTQVTKLVNGGTNGLDDRKQRYERCLKLNLCETPRVPGELREGDVGPQVVLWQKFLNENFPLYSKIDLTPQRYGPQTVAATKEFQRRVGITDGDGRNVGPKTLAAARKFGYKG